MIEWVWLFKNVLSYPLLGAAIGILLLASIRLVNTRLANELLKTYWKPGCQVIAALGLLYFSLWLSSEIYLHLFLSESENYRNYSLFTTRYLPWAQIRCVGPIVVLFTSQALWWPAYQSKTWLRWAVALAITLTINEGLVLALTSLHGDFLVSSWTMYYPSYYGLGLLFSMGSFAALVWVYQKLLPHFNPS